MVKVTFISFMQITAIWDYKVTKSEGQYAICKRFHRDSSLMLTYILQFDI